LLFGHLNVTNYNNKIRAILRYTYVWMVII
jgi:hypothetical protein